MVFERSCSGRWHCAMGMIAWERVWEDASMRFTAIVALLLLGTLSASAAGPPKLNIKATCKHAQPLSGGEKDAYQSCVNDENDAQKELIKTWSSFRAASQSTCKQETQIGGAPSYVELLTCLQLDKQAADAARENSKALNMPKAPIGPAKPN
jgi:hypothetical protein